MNYPKNRYTGKKPWMDRDWLYEEYVTKDRRTADIAAEYGCKQNTIQCWLVKHGIKKEIKTHYHKPKHQYEMYDYLYEQHIVLHKSMSEIARENDVSPDTIRLHLQKNGIEPWQTTPRTEYTEQDVDRMVDMYCKQKKSANEISKIFCTDHNTIIRHLRNRGIETRGMIDAQYASNGMEMPDDLKDPDLLYKLHWIDGISCKDIGKRYGVEAGTVRRQMNRIGVPTKTNAESKIGLMSGDKHPNWKGGISPLNRLLREYFHTNQVPKIAERDEYTCQLCGKTHTVLHVHHIVEFSTIVSEICSEHMDLNPDDVSDRMKLYDIITHDKRFLDEDNLITFCRDCHFFKIHNYDRKTISSQASTEEGSETIPEWEYTVSD